MPKKPVVVVTVASKEYMKYAIPFVNSFRKFHDWPLILYTDETDPKKLPKDCEIRDLNPFLKDPAFYYRQKPVTMEPLLDEYELVIGMDSDSLVLNDLSYIEKTKDYDVGTVINWNRFDEKVYPLVSIQGVMPVEYFNCGLIAIRSKKFLHHWNVLCFSQQFERLQYREQDLLNMLCYYGNYNVRCFDHGDGLAKEYSFWGILGKGEWVRSELRGKDIVVPKGLGDTPFPAEDRVVRVVTLAGGAGAIKDNWASFFPAEVMVRINEIMA